MKKQIWFAIAKKDFLVAIRDRQLIILAVIIWSLMLAAVFGGYKNYRLARQQRADATEMFRKEWNEQEANPHSAAHFGTYLFKPVNVLNIYDNGLNNYTGLSYRVEAHKRHDVNNSNAQDTDSQLRFGELTLALVFQLFLPLLIIFLAAFSVTRERENNTLRMLLVQGVKPAELLWGKVAGHYALVMCLVIPCMLLMAGIYFLFDHQQGIGRRLLLLNGVYAVYFFIITTLTVIVSTISRSSRASLLTSLGLWMFLGIMLPRIAAQYTDSSHPLPSRHEFDRKIRMGITRGLDNDGSNLERAEAFKRKMLAKYNVDTITSMPVNFDGLMMQYSEDYNAKVYNRYAGEVEKIIHAQQNGIERVGLLNPYIAIQQVSMGLAGSDYAHHLSFHHQAQDYRDDFIRQLNRELANSGSRYMSYSFRLGKAYYQQMNTFQYHLPAAGQAIKDHCLSWISIFSWLIMVAALIPLLSNKIYRN